MFPRLNLAQLPRSKRHAPPLLFDPFRAVFDAFDEVLDDARLLRLPRRALGSFQRLPEEHHEWHRDLGEGDTRVDGRAHEVFREDKGGLFNEPLVVDAALEVLLRCADGRLEVQRAKGRRFWLRGGRQCLCEHGEEVRSERDVGVRVSYEV